MLRNIPPIGSAGSWTAVPLDGAAFSPPANAGGPEPWPRRSGHGFVALKEALSRRSRAIARAFPAEGPEIGPRRTATDPKMPGASFRAQPEPAPPGSCLPKPASAPRAGLRCA